MVHFCGYSSQPYVRIACLKRDLYVSWGQDGTAEGVHRADDEGDEDVLYTFDPDKVTCEDCLRSMQSYIEAP